MDELCLQRGAKISGRQRLAFTVVLQKSYAQNTEEAAMSRDIQCADASTSWCPEIYPYGL